MAGAVFPETMNKLDPNNPADAITTLENYIGYMRERVEFSMKNTMRTAEASGVTNSAVLLMISSLSNALSALQSTVNQQGGELNSARVSIAAIQTSIDSLTETVGGHTSSLETMQAAIDELSERVSALENPG